MTVRNSVYALVVVNLSVSLAISQSSPDLKTRTFSPSEGQSRYANRLSGTVLVSLEKRLTMKNLTVGDPVAAKLKQDVKIEGRPY